VRPPTSIESMACGCGRAPSIGDGGVEGGKIDHAHRLRAEHERIVADAIGVDLRRHRRRADVVEALFRVGFDAAVEQVRGDDVDGILQPAPHRVEAARGVAGVARRPIVVRPGR
jgi:hypothetical protein